MTTIVSAATVRREIGRRVLGAPVSATRLGRIELQPHQRDAVARIERAMIELGGALLADETGLGKTYVALALARRSRRPLIVAPAALRAMWRQAMADADCAAGFVSLESLGRRGSTRTGRPAGANATVPVEAPDLVIVDEAHHARNPRTARYRALAELTAGTRVLLLSATPVHNSTRDLEALLALFLGARAGALDPIVAARCIIRRAHADAGARTMPTVLPAVALPVNHDERTLDGIVALPPPVPPADGGEAGILLTYSLIRQWASSAGALRGALRRRLARATALLGALESGRHPTAGELGAWTFADSAVQLALPGIVVAAPATTPLTDADCRALSAAVEIHAAAVGVLLRDLRDGPDTDAKRAALLTELRERHPGEHIVAFTQFAETASALFEGLRGQPRVCALTSAGAQVAGGALSRAEALARFAPRAQGATPPSAAHDIDLLLATDLLSEGVNLQDASVVVHLDVPWTPARLEQRVGRVARLGSRHARVYVYVVQPPASASTILMMEERLRAKLAAAARTVGIVGAIVPSLLTPGLPRAPVLGDAAAEVGRRRGAPRTAEAIRSLAAEWALGGSGAQEKGLPDERAILPLVGAVSAPAAGWIALLSPDRTGQTAGATPRIVADVGGDASEGPDILLRAMLLASGTETRVPEYALATALEDVERWRTAQRLRSDPAIDATIPARARRRVIERIAAITRRAPTHLRPSIASLAANARLAVTARFGAGAEHVLAELAQAPMADEAWLRAVKAFGEVHAHRQRGEGIERLRALLLLVPA